MVKLDFTGSPSIEKSQCIICVDTRKKNLTDFSILMKSFDFISGVAMCVVFSSYCDYCLYPSLTSVVYLGLQPIFAPGLKRFWGSVKTSIHPVTLCVQPFSHWVLRNGNRDPQIGTICGICYSVLLPRCFNV